jgi:hypothetical protein
VESHCKLYTVPVLRRKVFQLSGVLKAWQILKMVILRPYPTLNLARR